MTASQSLWGSKPHTYMVTNAGPCARCEMICLDQTTAIRAGPEPLMTLATYRRQKGRIHLGILLGHKGRKADLCR